MLKFLVLCVGFLPCLAEELRIPEFVILVPSYKNELWAKDNLKSICHQKSTMPYHVICINDCSPDKMGEIMDRYVEEHNLQSMVTVIHNKKNMGAMANVYNAIHNLIPNDKIVVHVDGDDALSSNEVLLQLEEVYKDSSIWMTYGSAIKNPGGTTDITRKIPDSISSNNAFRDYRFVSSHLRTFKSALFKKISKEDFLYEGAFYPMACDLAIMFPMLEMASKGHSKFISKVLYVYRMDNPISENQKNKRLQIKLAKHIRKKDRYEPISELAR